MDMNKYIPLRTITTELFIILKAGNILDAQK